jgi:hypothetical protein
MKYWHNLLNTNKTKQFIGVITYTKSRYNADCKPGTIADCEVGARWLEYQQKKMFKHQI